MIALRGKVHSSRGPCNRDKRRPCSLAPKEHNCRRRRARRAQRNRRRCRGTSKPKIRDSLASNDSARVDHADFGLNVGASVPANERLQPLPPQAEAIDPRLTGDKFLIVENEIVIVDPRTYSVVALIPEARGPEQSGAAQANEMSEDQQDQIRQSVANNSSACVDHADFALNVGAAVPRNEPLEPLPPEAVADNPQFSGDSFLVVEDRIVIVDPRTYRIAALIPEAGGPGEGGSVCAQL